MLADDAGDRRHETCRQSRAPEPARLWSGVKVVEDSAPGMREFGPPVDDPTGEPKLGPQLGPLAVVRRQRVLDRLPDGVRRPITPTTAPALTEREQEILGHLAALLTTEEIAVTMFVSVDTVKTHVGGILRKLAASRHKEAIRRARDPALRQGSYVGPDGRMCRCPAGYR